jgi:hypothetical protein
MNQFCITVGGQKHCFPVPLLVDQIHRPPPNNYPPFELALTVLELAKVAGPSPLAKELTEVSTRFIEEVRKQLPKGVSISLDGERMEQ